MANTCGNTPEYIALLQKSLSAQDWAGFENLCKHLLETIEHGNTAYICGNGGSAANSLHWANDLQAVLYKTCGTGVRMISLNGNISVLTCLGNDLSFEEIFSAQLQTLARKGDLLVCLSASGNSPNIIRAIEAAKIIGMQSVSIVGFDGGRAKLLSDFCIHSPFPDMQVVEDIQSIGCHLVTRTLMKTLGPKTLPPEQNGG